MRSSQKLSIHASNIYCINMRPWEWAHYLRLVSRLNRPNHPNAHLPKWTLVPGINATKFENYAFKVHFVDTYTLHSPLSIPFVIFSFTIDMLELVTCCRKMVFVDAVVVVAVSKLMAAMSCTKDTDNINSRL